MKFKKSIDIGPNIFILHKSYYDAIYISSLNRLKSYLKDFKVNLWSNRYFEFSAEI